MLSAIFAAPAAAASSAGLTVDFTPAWNGVYTPGRQTELGVSLIAERGGEYELVLAGGAASMRYSGSLEAEMPKTLWLPVRPRKGEPLLIELRRPGQQTLQREIQFSPALRPLVARVGQAQVGGDIQSVPVPLSGLPRTAQGYDSIRTLVLPGPALTALDQDQASALGSYLGGCGALLLGQADELLVARVRSVSGCGGRLVRPIGNDPTLGLLPPPGALPSDHLLNSLNGQPPTGAAPAITRFVLGYALLMLLGIWTLQHRLLLLALPLLASLGLILTWPLDRGGSSLVSWAEMETGDRAARYAALLTTGGGDDGRRQIPLARQLGLPQRGGKPPVELTLTQGQPAVQTLHTPSQPFEISRYRFQGTLPAPTLPALDDSAAVPQVINRDSSESPHGLLSWAGRIHQVPRLAPGAHWTPSEQTLAATDDDRARLLRERVGDSGTALLLPYSLIDAGLTPLQVQASGWLLVRAGG